MDAFPLAPLCPSFRAAPAAGQLYLTEAHRQFLDLVRTWIDGDRTVMVLTGEAGTGKTTLGREIGGADLQIARLGQTNAQLIDLPHQVPRAFGLSLAVDDPAPDPGQLMAACRGAERGCLLIVDEAQGLGDAALDYLARLTDPRADGMAVPHVLLVGGPGLESLLARPGHDDLRGRIGARFCLSPFTPAETAAYVAHRFRVSGCTCHAGVEVFDADALALLHAASGGLPRLINHLAQRCLFEARTTRRNQLDGAFVQSCLSDMAEEGGLPRLPPSPLPPHRDRPAANPPRAAHPDPVAPDTAPPDPAAPPPGTRQRHPLVVLSILLAAGLLLVRDPSPHDLPAASAQAALTPSLAEAAPRPSPPRRIVVETPPDPESLLVQALVVGGADPERAATLYARAALWGSDRAAYYLGQLYETGVGVEPDPQRARGWYELAPRVPGAAARLAELARVTPTTSQTTLAPVTVGQWLFGTGRTELHWRGPVGPDPARFRVEYVPAGGDGLVQTRDTRLSALLVPQPVTRWRVAALQTDGSVGPVSDWSVLRPAPR